MMHKVLKGTDIENKPHILFSQMNNVVHEKTPLEFAY